LSRAIELPARPARQEAGVERVVLLGASNLAKSFSTVVATTERAWQRPLEVLTALGHGRSYGRTTSVLGRTLPGILQCHLWPALARSPGVATAALVTDIGNDLLYEEPVATILVWVELCLDRLAEIGACTVVTRLPVGNLERLSKARFTLMRTLFFPGCRLNLVTCAERARQLNEGVERLAAQRGMALAEQRTDWYGFDPVHIRRHHRQSAWREILTRWSGPIADVPAAGTSLRESLYLRTRIPHHRRLLGFEQRRAQPSGRLPSGTTVSIY
jgi:hypothetical protein